MNTYSTLRKLAKKSKYQNLFLICKEFGGFRLFTNDRELSQIQDIFLNYLYMYDSIIRDINSNNISPHVLDNELYEDSYILWKNKKKSKEVKKETTSDVHLVASDKIIFPKKEVN